VSDDLYRPDFDLGEFRYSVARYVKYLIRARRKWDAEFLSDAQLTRWELNNIRDDKLQAWQLLEMAAATLAILNTEFLPRCGSGGVIVNDDDTPVLRLINSVAFLVPPEGGGPTHNQSLIDAAKVLRRQDAIDWESLADWETLSAVRDDLDLLPHPKQRKERKTRELNVTAKFPSPADLCWKKVIISFVSIDSVRVSAMGQSKTYMFSDLGFADKRKGDRPDTRWEILRELAKNGGRLAWDTDLEAKVRNCLQTAIKDIRKRLNALTGLQEDPFYGYRARKAYEAKFTIRDQSNSDQPAERETDEDPAD